MREDKQPIVSDDEMTDTELDQVSGGDSKPVVKPKPKPTTTSSGGGTLGDIKGESTDDKHKAQIELIS